MAKVIRDGATYSQKDIIEILSEFSAFKDRVDKKYKDLAGEFNGKPVEHDLWVSLFLIATDYAEEANNKRQRQEVIQKIS